MWFITRKVSVVYKRTNEYALQNFAYIPVLYYVRMVSLFFDPFITSLKIDLKAVILVMFNNK